jgi:hypothetical protein
MVFANAAQPNTRNVETSGKADVRRKMGTQPVVPTARLKVRLRRYTAVLMAQDHVVVGTNMVCSMAAAQSRMVRNGCSAFPSI